MRTQLLLAQKLVRFGRAARVCVERTGLREVNHKKAENT